MKKRIVSLRRLLLLFFLFILTAGGCGRDKSYIERKTEKALSYKSSGKKKSGKETSSSPSEENNNFSEGHIYVDVEGAVKSPGVYCLKPGSRFFEAIDLAGGFNDDAFLKDLNQAKVLEDGSRIYIRTVSEYEADPGQNQESQEDGVSADTDKGTVNINTASKDELMTLPGIGESKADSIIKYREKQKFSKPSDLMQISGIKEGVYNKIKDRIRV